MNKFNDIGILENGNKIFKIKREGIDDERFMPQTDLNESEILIVQGGFDVKTDDVFV